MTQAFSAVVLGIKITVPEPRARKGKLTNWEYLKAFVLSEVGILVFPPKEVEGLEKTGGGQGLQTSGWVSGGVIYIIVYYINVFNPFRWVL